MPKTETGSLVIRADAGPKIGAGHVMRCLALAQALRKRKAAVAFLGKAPAAIIDRVRAEGFEWRELSKAHPDPDDLAATRDFLDRQSADWLVLDGYHFTTQYHEAVRSWGFRLLVMDDDARQGRYEADILCNQNLGAQKLPYLFGTPTPHTLFGPRFALLRPEFARAVVSAPTPERADRLLVTMGGTDPSGGTFLALKSLRHLDREGLTVRIVTGLDNPREAEIRAAARDLGPGVELLSAVRDMASLLAWADMALTAAGSTVWEMCCLDLPMLLVVTAGNQEHMARAVESCGAALLLGPLNELDAGTLANRLNALRMDGPLRHRMGAAGKNLVDGRGAARVAAILTQEPRA